MRWLWMVGLAGCWVRPVTVDGESLSFDDDVRSVWIDVGAGVVDVRVADVVSVEVERTLRYSGDPPEVRATSVGGVLELTVDCRAFQGRCEADHVVLLPRSAAVEIHTGSGEVAVQGIADAVLVETGSGDVVLRDLAGDVDAITGSGDVVLDGMSGAVIQADTGSGDVELSCEVRPTRVEVSTGSGDVDVVVPSGVYHVATDTGSGDVALHGVTADRGADAVIDVSTGSGDIQLTGR